MSLPDHINTLLGRYTHLRPPYETQKRAFVVSVKKVCGFTLTEKDITITQGVVRVTAPATHKHKLFLQKERICREVNAQLTDTTEIVDIR